MATLEEVVNGLKPGQRRDITGLAKAGSEVLQYKENAKGKEELVTEIILEAEGKSDPVIIASLYQDKQLVEMEFFYQDEQQSLFKLVNSWLEN